MLARMTELSLQPGETLRIRTGRRLLVVMRSESSCEIRVVKRGMGVRIARALLASWLRMHRLGAAAVRRALRAWREAAQARLLARLDARTLRDIGMEPHHGNALAERVDRYRRRELVRTLTGRLGL
jgi:uncharacterized protein YjiS (DUF1127 family)